MRTFPMLGAALVAGMLSAQTTATPERDLVSSYGEAQRARIQRGLRQAASFWRAEDGDDKAFQDFALTQFAGDSAALEVLFARFEHHLEQLSGHMQEISRELRAHVDLDRGPILPFDEIFSGYDPSAHLLDDFFHNKLAFAVLLNFPLTTLEQRLTEGEKWSRQQWAEARLAQRFAKRIPGSVALAISQATAEAERYIAEYNIWMDRLVDREGKRLFPPKLRLLSHWNLRDEIKADYRDPAQGLAKQRMIQQVMERIVTQTIPASVINNPRLDWNPYTNEVKPETPASPPDTRYAKLLSVYRAVRQADPHSPTAPTFIARRFDEDREIPEARFRAMLEQVLSSPLAPRAARLIESRLGRKLEPFDIWYDGFRQRGPYPEAQLDQIVAKRYPSADAFQNDIPRLLRELGFSPERAKAVAGSIVVDPARGSGHAWGAAMRSEKAHLRTRVEKGGMNYKGYNIAIHEMGHNVEQTFSLQFIDHTLLAGVPNTAFTEALAMVFQGHDLELLGLAKPDPSSRALHALDEFWQTMEISGVSLVDMGVWHWMYDHPEATPEQLKEATLRIAKDVWNRHFSPVFGMRDVVLLGIYSHMIEAPLYLPDYAVGHMIALQIEQHMEKAGRIGPEFERMARLGAVAPDVWMKQATGAPVGPEALLAAAAKAIEKF